jgi:integrase
MYLAGSPWRKRQADKHRTITDRGYLNRDGHVRNYLIPLFGNDDPRTLTRRYVDDKLLEASRGETPKGDAPIKGGRTPGGKPLSPATMVKITNTLIECLEEIVDQGVIPKNPIEGLKPFSRGSLHPREDVPGDALAIIYPPSHGAMMRIWGSSMWVACMCMLHDTGMRPGELRALLWGQINTAARGVVIRKGIEAGTRATRRSTKTKIVRAAFLSQRTLQELAIWREETKHSGDDDFIFMQSGAAPVTDEGIIKAFRAGVKAAGLDHHEWTPYWLRHSFITHNLDVLTDREMETLAGHTNAQTNAIYRHPDDEAVLKRAKPIQDKLEGKWKKDGK